MILTMTFFGLYVVFHGIAFYTKLMFSNNLIIEGFALESGSASTREVVSFLCTLLHTVHFKAPLVVETSRRLIQPQHR